MTLGMVVIFLYMTPKAQFLRKNIDKMDFYKLKTSVKNSVKRISHRLGKTLAKKDISDKGLLPKIDKELLKFNSKKTN